MVQFEWQSDSNSSCKSVNNYLISAIKQIFFAPKIQKNQVPECKVDDFAKM